MPRLFVADDLAAGASFALNDGQAHYLCHVLRAKPGQSLRLFNGRDGEWCAVLREVTKKKVLVAVTEMTVPQMGVPNIHVLAAVVKKDAFETMVQKACELGAASFRPVITDHTVVRRVNTQRMAAIAQEAAEQCERLTVMDTHDVAPWRAALAALPEGTRVFTGVARSESVQSLTAALAGDIETPVAVLIGPEGGFSDAEKAEILQGIGHITPVALGPRILRADTALIAALSLVQAYAGDW
ncbi:MAG: 16S rRNA (uracil(1498)-N(3))-methyltransferase [Alphaproteobacteria bacterium]|nr:16S rRNA (uracil(1498)-N(3))-methyltransferase [Alphaproteobacteria bacterium]